MKTELDILTCSFCEPIYITVRPIFILDKLKWKYNMFHILIVDFVKNSLFSDVSIVDLFSVSNRFM